MYTCLVCPNREYLYHIIDILTIRILNLPLSFLKQHISSSPPETADVEALKLEVEELREKNKKLEEEMQEMKAKVRSDPITSRDQCSILHNFYIVTFNLTAISFVF